MLAVSFAVERQVFGNLPPFSKNVPRFSMWRSKHGAFFSTEDKESMVAVSLLTLNTCDDLLLLELEEFDCCAGDIGCGTKGVL